MNTNKLVRVSKEIFFQEKTLHVEEFVTNSYFYMKTAGKDMFYTIDTKQLYTIDNTNQTLTLVNMQMQKKQAQQLKGMLNDFLINTEEQEGEKRHVISGKGNTLTVFGEVVSRNYEMLNETIYSETQHYLNQSSFVDLSLHANELIESSDITINLQGNIMVNKVVVTTVEQIVDEIDRFDYLLNYTIQN